jgi:hypothetical protein
VPPAPTAKSSGFTSTPATAPTGESAPETSGITAKLGAAMNDKYTSIKNMLIGDAIKYVILSFFTFILLFAPIFDGSFAEYFFENVEYIFEYPEDFILSACFVWAVTILVRLVIKAVKKINMIRKYDDIYCESLCLMGDELYSAFTDGKCGRRDARLLIEHFICLFISLVTFASCYGMTAAMVIVPIFFTLLIDLPFFFVKKIVRQKFMS